MHEDGVDLISNLPDPVLLLILSGLPSTKESIRTSILSSRWRYLWTSIPSLNFEYRGGWNRQKSQFINIVNWALLQRPVEYRGGWNRPEDISKFINIVNWAFLQRSVNLDSFHLSCSDFFSTSTIERWIDQTVLRNVKQLDLWFWGKSVSDDMEMPHCLATCASLEVLKLCLGRRLIVPSLSGFPALRVLNLEYVELCDHDLVEYILDCPLLEELTLDDCKVDKLDLLCISCPKLKKLSLSYIGEDDLCGCLKVSCPNLVFLAIQGQIASNYTFESLYSLKEALIDPDSYGLLHLFHAISRLFHFISHVESLWTNLSFLYQYCINAARDPALPNLKTLELTTVNDNCTVKGLKKILNICPKLESLVLTVENDHTYEEEKQMYNETEYPNLDEVGTWNLTPDVAWVEFFEFNGEKPKLRIQWDDKNKSKWTYVAAKWGNSLDGPMFYQLW